MLKRISGLIGFVILSFTVATYAQLAVGDWQIYTSTGTPVKVIDTPQRVYYVSGRSLFGFDKETEEMESYSKNNILNDIDIANIYYNYDKKYLVIVYANSNVDILHDNGKVFNIPDIKNAILTTAKGINDVKFYGDRIYLATDFGIVVLNDKKNEVSESYNYGKKISLIGACDKYWFFVADDGLYYINSDAIKYDIAKWVLLDDVPGTTIYALMPFNDKYLFYSKGGNLHFLDINNGLSLLGTLNMGVMNVDKYYDGFVLRGYVYVAFCKPDIVNGAIQFDGIFNFQNQSDYLVNVLTSLYEKDMSMWALGESGLCHFSMGNNQFVMLKEPFLPNVSNVADPWNLVINDHKLYVSNSGPRRGTEDQYVQTKISVLDQGNWSVTDVGEVPLENGKTGNRSDWYQFGYSEIKNNKYAKLLIPNHSTAKWVVYGDWPGSIFAFDDKGTYNTIADDRTKNIVSFMDQDNKTFTPNYYTCIEEDNNGQIWIGTSSGPIVITNPDHVFSDSFRCTRIKIARNDGTDNADYLLQNINITDIFVDGANRKWIGTRESGLYLVSADGSEILNHFTAENSKLPSNHVTEVIVDPVTGVAYIGTTSGLAAYRSDAVQSSDDYSNVYAFPNPVRPDYEGWISVTGLMENSLVKITDTAGNLFFQGYSNGGQISWDGRDRSGNRVKTGVYLVFASSSGSSKQSGVVTKILVVN